MVNVMDKPFLVLFRERGWIFPSHVSLDPIGGLTGDSLKEIMLKSSPKTSSTSIFFVGKI
jgi:hypothetical protein